ncbi:MAG: archease [Candidatus Omnitrophica bacterium]|nr:archease [Candidatus Omnitrophota bacterium]
MKKYEFIDHTADAAVRVYGKTLEELFNNAAEALLSLLADIRPFKEKEHTVTLKGTTVEDLLVNWLNELTSLFFADKFFPAAYNVVIDQSGTEKKLSAILLGKNFMQTRENVKMEIKAATYHNLKIEKDSQGYHAEIIFDV